MRRLSAQQIDDLCLLEDMYQDGYFPDHLVDRVKEILITVCRKVEKERPQDNDDLYVITQAATEEINDLQEVFEDAGSEIETVARESIAVSFDKISRAYGYEADVEELIATREW